MGWDGDGWELGFKSNQSTNTIFYVADEFLYVFWWLLYCLLDLLAVLRISEPSLFSQACLEQCSFVSLILASWVR